LRKLPVTIWSSFALAASAVALAELVVGPAGQGQAREVIGLEAARSTVFLDSAVDERRSVTGRIAFSAGPHPHEDVYVVNPDGSGLERLTDDPGADFDPSWSSDGRRIAYRHESGSGDSTAEIYVMNASGSQKRNLTRRPGQDHSPGLVAGREEDRVCLRPRRPDAERLGDECRRLQAAAGEPSERRVSGLVAQREKDRVRPEHVRPDRLGYLGDERRRLSPEAVHRITGGRARRGVVSGREDDRVRLGPRRIPELQAHMARERRWLGAASAHKTYWRTPGLVEARHVPALYGGSNLRGAPGRVRPDVDSRSASG
jgi:hypothetical protein